MSLACAPASGNIQRSLEIPSRSAVSTEVNNTTAPCSTILFEFISLVYGELIHRLSGPGVAISSAVYASLDQAWPLVTATALNRCHSCDIAARWSAMDAPPAIRIASSKSG
ncbi:Uncharacterised protein [Mycobacteroides abscessus]|nr:Uncharacterised protein [Mycobacteroides abscessus]